MENIIDNGQTFAKQAQHIKQQEYTIKNNSQVWLSYVYNRSKHVEPCIRKHIKVIHPLRITRSQNNCDLGMEVDDKNVYKPLFLLCYCKNTKPFRAKNNSRAGLQQTKPNLMNMVVQSISPCFRFMRVHSIHL